MTLKELQNWINNNLFKENGYINASKISGKAKWIDKNNRNAKESIIYFTFFLSEDSSYSRRIWHIINNIFYIPKCECCGKETTYIKFNRGYKKVCGMKCASLKGKERFKEKHGDVNSPLQIEEFNVKVKKTKKERHGDENFTNREKSKETCLEKYGVESVAQVKEVKEKRQQTNLERYGVEHPLLNEEVDRKARETCLEKYGVECVAQCPEIAEKQEEGFKKSYKRHDYQFPSGQWIRLQGYEPQALDILLKSYKEEDIFHKKTDMPEIWYTTEDNIEHRYYPDFYIPKNNLIIEVKSIFTYDYQKEINELKRKATKDYQYHFELMII